MAGSVMNEEMVMALMSKPPYPKPFSYLSSMTMWW
jgi:hypothetical protein